MATLLNGNNVAIILSSWTKMSSQSKLVEAQIKTRRTQNKLIMNENGIFRKRNPKI